MTYESEFFILMSHVAYHLEMTKSMHYSQGILARNRCSERFQAGQYLLKIGLFYSK